MLLLLLRSMPSGAVVYTRAPSGGGFVRANSLTTVRPSSPNTVRPTATASTRPTR